MSFEQAYNKIKEKLDDFYSHEKSGPDKAKIKILKSDEYGKKADQINMPEDNEEVVKFVQLNPNKITVNDGVNYGQESIKNFYGRKVPHTQYSNHNARELTVELLFDTYTTYKKESDKEDVKEKYIDEFLKLMNPEAGQNQGDYKPPPLVFFSWGSIQLKGYVTIMNCTYTMFTSTGKPVRATVNLTIKEYFHFE